MNSKTSRLRRFFHAIGGNESILSPALWANVWELTKPFFRSDKEWDYRLPLTSKVVKVKARSVAWTLCITLFVFLATVNGMNALINIIYGAFQNALPGALTDQSLVDTAWHTLGILAAIFVVAGPIVAFYKWFKELFAIAWRRWLTESLLEIYIQDRNYYKVAHYSTVENPDERIAADIEGFVTGAVKLVTAVLDSIISAVFFAVILWHIAASLTATVILYSSLGTLISIWLSVKLIYFKRNQVRLEADYRYFLVNYRNNVEPIGFYQGEKAEWKLLLDRFYAAINNNLSLIGYQRRVSLFTNWFEKFVVILPFAVVLPLYLRHEVQIGAFTQASMAFSQVLGALAIFVEEIATLSALAAFVSRLTDMQKALAAPETCTLAGNKAIVIEEAENLAFEELKVLRPGSIEPLVEGLNLSVPNGTGLLIKGPSGFGKTMLLRVIAELSRLGEGIIRRPNLGSVMFLSQKPYMPLGNLRQVLLYPHLERDVSDAELQTALDKANIGYLSSRFKSGFNSFPGEETNDGYGVQMRPWSDVLSPGEQQRLVLARVLLFKPKFVFLDEATSALDNDNEKLLYEMMKELGATFISVGHRESLEAYHEQTLTLLGNGKWVLEAA